MAAPVHGIRRLICGTSAVRMARESWLRMAGGRGGASCGWWFLGEGGVREKRVEGFRHHLAYCEGASTRSESRTSNPPKDCPVTSTGTLMASASSIFGADTDFTFTLRFRY